MRSVAHLFRPNEAISSATLTSLCMGWVVLSLALWATAASPILPSPLAVATAIPELWSQDGLGEQLWISMVLNFEAVAIMTLLSLTVSYLTVLPIWRPVGTFISVGRFNGYLGLPLLLTLYIGNPHWIKVALLVYAMTVFMVPSVVTMILEIPKEEFDHARTLRMREWRVVWEVVVLGRFDEVIEMLRNVAAMGWLMVPMAEGLFKSEGGLGALVDIENHHFNLSAVYAIVLVVLAVGFAQDYLIGVFKGLICPFSLIGLERR